MLVTTFFSYRRKTYSIVIPQQKIENDKTKFVYLIIYRYHSHNEFTPGRNHINPFESFW
ncbi:hypothetical protein RO31_1754 [Francisella tularensis subsp. tularensis str. SCHU S4 substr. NR-28534]|nr:hypothetical protein RO31_1754 [Francisella tularensis subsp. tularensis str. SCHU S4 substr. NR-28534]